MYHVIGLGIIVTAIAFAFGLRTAQACVGVGLVAGALAFAYVAFLIVTNQI